MIKSSKYHIITFGCQMNKSDSQRIASVLEQLGFESVKNYKDADVAIINACSVRQTAIDRIWGLVKNLQTQPRTLKILTGCLLPKDKQSFEKKFDLVFNIKEINKLSEFLVEQKICSGSYFNVLPKLKNNFEAFVPIMTGCNNFCSYCAVPYVRGSEVSRSVKDILSEINKLVKKGVVSITLLGQNVNSFKPDDLYSFSKENPFDHAFAKLLWEVNEIPQIKRIFFTSAHPKDMSDDVIDALKLPKIVNYLHLALQSGDDDILKKMNRGYSVLDYQNIIKKVRQVRPQMAIGTDIIVGFPSETQEQFENTYNFYQKIKFDIAYIAMYSSRSGTKAADFIDDVSYKEKKIRWRKLQNLMERISKKKNQQYVGAVVQVLVDKYENGYCQGNCQEMKTVKFKGEKKDLGKIITVKIDKAQEWLLSGKKITA